MNRQMHFTGKHHDFMLQKLSCFTNFKRLFFCANICCLIQIIFSHTQISNELVLQGSLT